jgi:hypothetical protein
MILTVLKLIQPILEDHPQPLNFVGSEEGVGVGVTEGTDDVEGYAVAVGVGEVVWALETARNVEAT